MNAISEGSLSELAGSLTAPQKIALRLFTPKQARRIFPEINPRTAQALWSIGLLTRDTREGVAYFMLSDVGEKIKQVLSAQSL